MGRKSVTDIFGIPATTIAGYMAGAVGAIVLALLLFAAVNRILLRMALRNIPPRRAQAVLIPTGHTSSENAVIFGVGSDFESVWGTIHSRSGGRLTISALGPTDVFIGSSLADHIAARIGDSLQVYVDGHPITVTVRGIIDTEI